MKKSIFLLFLVFAYANTNSQPYFQKITTGIIATDLSSSSMSAWADYDNDGKLDLIVTPWNDGCWSCRSPIFFYRNNGNGVFGRGNSVLVDQVLSCNGIAFGDYDNDGRIDLLITRYFNQKNLLFHNESYGDFNPVITGPVVTDVASSMACGWADYDKDGWIDLFVSHGLNQNNALYHNNGNGTFTKITTGEIVNNGGDSRGCAWGDYDNDGWPDLFVANYGVQKAFLYHNNMNGTFTRILSGAPVDSAGYGEDGNWFDYDNDGWLDLFVTRAAATDRLFHNNHDGTFTLTNFAPSQEWGWSYYSTCGDIDNDGWTDIFVPKRNQNGYTGINALFKNVNGTSFTKITGDIVTQEGGSSDAGIFGDFNSDGKLDLFVGNGSTGGYSQNFIYQNVYANSGNYITLNIKGCVSNTSAIGARVRVIAGNLKQMHEISGGTGSQSMLWQHFGLGSATMIDSIIVYYTTGNTKTITNVPVNQFMTITDCPLGFSNNEIPLKYELKQNYPNPFNPETQISYSLMRPSNVKLTIIDITGKVVKVLVNEYQNAGNFVQSFDGSELASGIYIYRIESEEFSDVKKMILLK